MTGHGHRLLGAVLAGGAARRFGADKALARLDGIALIDHVIARLAPQADAVVVCGRSHGAYHSLDDSPAPDLGPLGGLCAALLHARAHGFDAVLSAACDVPFIPPDLATRLAGYGAAHVADCPVIGWWPTSIAETLRVHLAASRPRSLYAWAKACGARAVAFPGLANVNTREDLALIQTLTRDPPQAEI